MIEQKENFQTVYPLLKKCPKFVYCTCLYGILYILCGSLGLLVGDDTPVQSIRGNAYQ